MHKIKYYNYEVNNIFIFKILLLVQKFFFPAPQWIALCTPTLEPAGADNPFKHSQNAQQCESKWHLTAAEFFVLPNLILLLNYQPSNYVYKFWYLLKTMLKRGVKKSPNVRKHGWMGGWQGVRTDYKKACSVVETKLLMNLSWNQETDLEQAV